MSGWLGSGPIQLFRPFEGNRCRSCRTRIKTIGRCCPCCRWLDLCQESNGADSIKPTSTELHKRRNGKEMKILPKDISLVFKTFYFLELFNGGMSFCSFKTDLFPILKICYIHYSSGIRTQTRSNRHGSSI